MPSQHTRPGANRLRRPFHHIAPTCTMHMYIKETRGECAVGQRKRALWHALIVERCHT